MPQAYYRADNRQRDAPYWLQIGRPCMGKRNIYVSPSDLLSSVNGGSMLVSYASSQEFIVTTSENEQEMLRVWFKEGGRDLEDYDRREHGTDEAVSINARLTIW